MTLIRFHPDCFRKCFTFLFRKLFFYYSSLPSSFLEAPHTRAFFAVMLCFMCAYAFILCLLFMLLLLFPINRAFTHLSSCKLVWRRGGNSSHTQWLMSIKWGEENPPHTPCIVYRHLYSRCRRQLVTLNKSTTHFSNCIRHQNFLWQIYEAFTMTKLVNDVSHKSREGDEKRLSLSSSLTRNFFFSARGLCSRRSHRKASRRNDCWGKNLKILMWTL